MSLASNVVRRRGIFYFRCRVPIGLVSRIGRRELNRSLRTSCPSLARARGAVAHSAAQRLWAELRGAVTKDEIDRLVAGWLAGELDKDAAARTYTKFAEDHVRPGQSVGERAAELFFDDAEVQLTRWRDIVQRHEWTEAEPDANLLLKEHGFELPKDSQPYRLLCQALCLAKAELHSIKIDRSEGNWSTRPQRFAPSSDPPRSVNDVAPAAPSPLVSKAVQDFIDETRRLRRLRPKRVMDFEAALNLLRRHVGADPAVNRVTKAQIGELRLMLPKLPPNFTKRFPGRTLGEVVTIAAEKGLPTLNPTTVNHKYLAVFEQFFGWCINCGYMSENPAIGVRVKTPRSKTVVGRGTFRGDELVTLFSAPLFTGCKSDGRIYEAGICSCYDDRHHRIPRQCQACRFR
jgi:hypothetical protein